MRFLRNDLVVSVRSHLVDESIEQSADQNTDTGTYQEQAEIEETEKHQELIYDRQYYNKVDTGKDDWDHEYRKHLRVDTLLDLIAVHSDLLHDAEP